MGYLCHVYVGSDSEGRWTTRAGDCDGKWTHRNCLLPKLGLFLMYTTAKILTVFEFATVLSRYNSSKHECYKSVQMYLGSKISLAFLFILGHVCWKKRCHPERLSWHNTCSYFIMHVVLLRKILVGVHSVSESWESLYLCTYNGGDMQMKHVCSKTKKPCDCLCQDCGRDRWGCLKPPCTCPLQLNGTFGLDFAVRKQRLKCKCRWKNGRVLPRWMCKCKVRATWFLVSAYHTFALVADDVFVDVIQSWLF